MDEITPRPMPAHKKPPDDYALLPVEAPLAMVAQPLRPLPGGSRIRDRLTLPRAALFLMAFLASAAFAYTLYKVLSIVRVTPLQAVFLVLCTLCFAWIALGASSAVLGFVTLPFQRPRTDCDVVASVSRIALLFPVYEEDAARVAATIEAMARDLALCSVKTGYDVFVLSDSRQSRSRTRELRAVRHLRRQIVDGPSIYYRSRVNNTEKKAGNIADWVRRFGGAYDAFVILDADSIMSGALIVRLATELQSAPRVGLIQTVPRLVNGRTLFARLQQFAVGYYGPVIAAGFAAWYQGSGNYWGHNAIVRTRAFAEAAALPNLSGGPPLGGHVQSHDFAEAAFLRRGGWEVRMLPYLPGSYEGCPPTLVDVAVRDRRWAQGNIQHARLLYGTGLPLFSRVHLAMGIYAYLSSTLWAASLVVGMVLAFQSVYTLPSYFPDEKTLFPVWPVIDAAAAYTLFLVTIAVVLFPKVCGLLAAFAGNGPALGTRDRLALLAGASIEIALSILAAPVLMLTQTRAIFEIMLGKDSGWSAQQRVGGGLDLAATMKFHAGHMLVGAVTLCVCYAISPYVLAWMSPIFSGLLLSGAITYITAKDAPHWLAAVLATGEDYEVPPVVAAANAGTTAWAERLARAEGDNVSAGAKIPQ